MTEECKSLLTVISAVSGESVEALTSRSRQRPRPVCRYAVADYLMHHGYSSASAGRALGLTHTTVLHGCKLVRLIKDEAYARQHGFALEYDIVTRFATAVKNTDGQKV